MGEEFNLMNLEELQKELKARGLLASGDRTVLIARLQDALWKDFEDDYGETDLDLDEIDSTGLPFSDNKALKISRGMLFSSDRTVLQEQLQAAQQQSSHDHHGNINPPKKPPETEPQRTSETGATDNNEACTEKIGPISVTTSSTKSEEKKIITPPEPNSSVKPTTIKIKISADIDYKTRLEMRAKRFGLPAPLTDEQRKEARKQRFYQRISNNTLIDTINSSLDFDLDKLKKRAERFGQSVSPILNHTQNLEKLEKRKARFSIVVNKYLNI